MNMQLKRLELFKYTYLKGTCLPIHHNCINYFIYYNKCHNKRNEVVYSRISKQNKNYK